jgi:hypothetical protein
VLVVFLFLKHENEQFLFFIIFNVFGDGFLGQRIPEIIGSVKRLSIL